MKGPPYHLAGVVVFLAVALLIGAENPSVSNTQGFDISGFATLGGEGEVPVIITYNQAPDDDDIDDLEEIGKVKRTLKLIPAVSADLDLDDIHKVYSNPKVAHVSADFKLYTLLTTSVPQIGADKAHAAGFTGKGSKVCIPDTGATNPTLTSSIVAQFDFVNNDSDASDDNGHGTHVAGIVHAVAPDADLIIAKVFGRSGVGFASDIIAGIDFCVSQGADAISLSFGTLAVFTSVCDANSVSQAINTAFNSGSVVASAAGNNGKFGVVLPACASGAMAIGAVDSSNNLASFSNFGPLVSVVAPGVSITSLGRPSGSSTRTGTSMSTPHAAGVAALLVDDDDDDDDRDREEAEEIREQLEETATNLGDPKFGNGLVNAAAALDLDDDDEED